MDIRKWRVLSWFCPNCGNLERGITNTKGHVKSKCRKCGADMILKIKGRRHTSVEVFAPKP